MKFIATLAFLGALTFLTVEAQKYTKKSSCSREQKICERGFYFSKHDCACRCGLRSRDCFYPQQLNKTACECQCPPNLNESKCINWQEWDEDWCECYCPYSKHHKCPPKKVWNYKNCHCDCINKEPKGGCRNGKWNKNECQCIPNPTTTTTTSMPLCLYGTKAYNNDYSIDGIEAGLTVDGTTAYVGFTQIDGIKVLGTLPLNDSFLPGLTYIYNNNVTLNQTSNVFYLTNTPDCNCQFIDKNASLPVGSYKVTLNNGTNRVHIGINDDTVSLKFNTTGTMVGTIINESLHYFNGYDKFEATTENYKILICGSSFNVTTTSATATTVNNANNTSTASTTANNAKIIDDSCNRFMYTILVAFEILGNFNSLKDEIFLYINISLSNVNTTKAEIEFNQKILDIFDNSMIVFQNSITGQRKKRQTIDICQNATQLVKTEKIYLNYLQANYKGIQYIVIQFYQVFMNFNNITISPDTQNMCRVFLTQFRNLTIQINQCKKYLNELTVIRDDVCSKTTTAIPTTTPASCAYSWNLYAGNNLPPSDGFYVGKNPYGNDIYVGAGTGGGDYAPGSLEPLYLNGVTVQSSLVVYNVTTNVTYLAIPSSCKCNWLPNGDLYNIPALVRLRNFYWVGRYNFTDGSHVVGKVYDQGSGYGIIMTHVENNQEILGTVFDVLQCTVS